MHEIHENTNEVEKMPHDYIEISGEKKTDLKRLTEDFISKADDSKREKVDQNVEKIHCQHEDLAGKNHPVTDVPYHRKTIEVDGKMKEGVFPEFESQYDVKLPKEYYKKTDAEQFEQCNWAISDAAKKDKELRSRLNDCLDQFEEGLTPECFTWHHNENPGVFQLVDTYTHSKTGHTGGRSIWGGGSEYRY